MNQFTKSMMRGLRSRWTQPTRVTNMLCRAGRPMHNSRRTFGVSRNLPATTYRSHRQWSDCAFGEPAYQTLFNQPAQNLSIDSMFQESAEAMLSSHRMVNDMRMVDMGYSIVTGTDTTERLHSVAFVTVHHPLSSREKESLIHELLFLCGKHNNAPSKIFIVDSIPSLEDERVDRMMMSE